ncbi:MAG: hypothetical protein ACKPAC_20175, partial [Alphaproteobacteria bacterium]
MISFGAQGALTATPSTVPSLYDCIRALSQRIRNRELQPVVFIAARGKPASIIPLRPKIWHFASPPRAR